MVGRRANCLVCTGCGKCGKTPESLHVLMEFELEKRGQQYAEAGYIAAVDIGTTTIAMVLRRISDGELVGRFAVINPQRRFGFDVISRIQIASDPAVAEEMRLMVQEVIENGIREFWKILEQKAEDKEALLLVSIAANTTMCYLLLGYDPAELGQAPFSASHLEEERGEILGIPLLILPGISAFVGADIMAGIYASGMAETEKIQLLVDLGTNGEMVLGNRTRLISTSTAAGSAFEGSGENGSWACDRVALIARLLEEGIIDDTGLMGEPYFENGYWIEGVLITQQDIRMMQMAKAAVCAGIFLLCQEYGIIPGQIDRIYLAGGFGRQLSPEAAEKIGLIPAGLKHKSAAVGNSALEGAFLYGRNKKILSDNKKILSDNKKIIVPAVVNKNLAALEQFDKIYLSCMQLSPIEQVFLQGQEEE